MQTWHLAGQLVGTDFFNTRPGRDTREISAKIDPPKPQARSGPVLKVFCAVVRGLLQSFWGPEDENVHRRKSVGAERTFGRLANAAELFDVCKRVCESVAEDLKREVC